MSDEGRPEGTYPSAEDYPPKEAYPLEEAYPLKMGNALKNMHRKKNNIGTMPNRGSLRVNERGAPGCFCPAPQKGSDWEGGEGNGVRPPKILPHRKGAGNYAQLAGSWR